jgi:hypothetical protein
MMGIDFMLSKSAPSTTENARVYAGLKEMLILHQDEEGKLRLDQLRIEKVHNRLL